MILKFKFTDEEILNGDNILEIEADAINEIVEFSCEQIEYDTEESTGIIYGSWADTKKPDKLSFELDHEGDDDTINSA